ncbi:uncharacterized protein LOC106174517 [Lingula anatina]|uniref:Uncharacterized protein LOC106174517 n=1 Tax=Lingula anatina TaxID=7574 RepID=A0A1S3JN42_LINAN|nr:uncharacterized protein LOC106174517 [Lingula anatina]|eukprot:XP_013411571.1 uncharacterized protein LOC106174517 [Lingula anatina]
MEAFLGDWVSIRDEVDWTPFMKASGMDDEKIEFYNKLDKEHDTIMTFAKEGDGYIFKSESGPVKYSLNFQLGKPYEMTFDEMNITGIFKLENGALIDESKISGNNATVTSRTISGDTMVADSTTGGITLSRSYKKK